MKLRDHFNVVPAESVVPAEEGICQVKCSGE